MPASRDDKAAGGDLELAKWLALATMAIDHYGKIVEPALIAETHAIGRLSFPLFAAIIALRLAEKPDRALRYAKRLLPWAVISQPAYVMAGREWFEGNVMFTLLAGVLAIWLIDRFTASRRPYPLIAAAALAPAAWFTDFGTLGAAMIPVLCCLERARPDATLWATGPLALAANLVPSWPPLILADLPALASGAFLALTLKLDLNLPRLPTHMFYGFYPAHLLTFHLWDLYV